MSEQRFAKEARFAANDEPGLVQTPDGKVYLVKPNGDRVDLSTGGGGGGDFTNPLLVELEIAPTDNTLSDLLNVVIPSGYGNTSPTGNTIVVTDTDTGEIVFQADAYGGILSHSPTGFGHAGVFLTEGDSTKRIDIQTGSGITVRSVNGALDLGNNDGSFVTFRAEAGDAPDSGGIGFFNVTPAIQQTHPTTLQNVIDILVAFGLCEA